MAVGLRLRDAGGNLLFDSTYQRVFKEYITLSIPQNAWGTVIRTSHSTSEGISNKVYIYPVNWLDPSKHFCLHQSAWVESGQLCMHTTRAQNTWATSFLIYEF